MLPIIISTEPNIKNMYIIFRSANWFTFALILEIAYWLSLSISLVWKKTLLIFTLTIYSSTVGKINDPKFLIVISLNFPPEIACISITPIKRSYNSVIPIPFWLVLIIFMWYSSQLLVKNAVRRPMKYKKNGVDVPSLKI